MKLGRKQAALILIGLISLNYLIFYTAVNVAISSENYKEYEIFELPPASYSNSSQSFNEIDWSLYGQNFAITTSEGDVAIYDEFKQIIGYINYPGARNASLDRFVDVEWANEDNTLIVAYPELNELFTYDIEKKDREMNTSITSPSVIKKSPDAMYIASLEVGSRLSVLDAESFTVRTEFDNVTEFSWIGETQELVMARENVVEIGSIYGKVRSIGERNGKFVGNPVYPQFAIYDNHSVQVWDLEGKEIFEYKAEKITKFLLSWDVTGKYLAFHDKNIQEINIWNVEKGEIEFGSITGIFDDINWLNTPGYLTAIGEGVLIWSFPEVFFTESTAYKLTPVFTSTIIVIIYSMFYYLGTIESKKSK